MSIDEANQEKIFTEVKKWLSSHGDDPHSSDKAKRYKNLLQANQTLQTKLNKLKLLYEKKNAQYEVMKEALDLERDLYDSDWSTLLSSTSTTQMPSIMSTFSGLEAKMEQLATPKDKEEFFRQILSKTMVLLSGVKEYVLHGEMTEDIITSCMEIFSQENPSVLFVPPAVASYILVSVSEKIVFQTLNQLNAGEYNWCFFTFCDKHATSNTDHWSLLLYTRGTTDGDDSGIYHYDSQPDRNREIARKFSAIIALYFNTRKFNEVRCIPQKEAGESGLHVIENMTKLLPMLETGKIVVDNVEINLENISLLRVFTMKCRVLVIKLYLQRKLQLLRAHINMVITTG